MSDGPGAPRRGLDVDRALDAALREMAGGDGPADMRRRVLARLDDRLVRRQPLVWLAAGAVATVLVTAIVLLRGTTPAPEAAVPVARATAAPVRPSVDDVAASAPTPGPPTLARAQAPARRRPAEAPPGEPLAAADVEPIELTRLSVPAMGEEPRIAVAALRIETMEIEPLVEARP
jgi:hypothetical protein